MTDEVAGIETPFDAELDIEEEVTAVLVTVLLIKVPLPIDEVLEMAKLEDCVVDTCVVSDGDN